MRTIFHPKSPARARCAPALCAALFMTVFCGEQALFAAEAPAGATPPPAEQETLRDLFQPGLAQDAVRRYVRAVALHGSGEIGQAREVLISLTRDYPSYYRALVLLGRCYDQVRERRLAYEVLDQAVKVRQEENIRDSSGLFDLAMLHLNDGNLDEAEKAFQEAVKLTDVNSPELSGRIYNAMGHIEMERGNDEAGLKLLEIAASEYGNESAHRTVELRKNKASIDKVLERADRAVKPDPTTAFDITTTLPIPEAGEGEAGAAAQPAPPASKDAAAPSGTRPPTEPGAVGAGSME